MSLESNKNRNDYIGNGAVREYSYTFKIFNEQHLRVTVKDLNDDETELQLGIDYTVTGVGDETGGNILLTSNGQAWIDANDFLVDQFVFTIRRVVSLTQETDFRNQGSFLPENHEDTFDLSRMIDQQQQDEIDRSVKLPETIPATDFDTGLPGGIQTPDSTIITNPTGTGFDMGPTANEIANAQAYAISAGHSKDTAKDWAIKTDGTVVDSETGIDSGEYSSKENAIGILRRGQSGGGSSKDWANHLGGTVDDTEYSAKHYADQAATAAAAAVASAATAAVNASRSNWNDVIYLTFANSPYTVADSQSGALFEVDTTAGHVEINLPEIANLDLNGPFSYSFVKSDASTNEIRVNSGGTDTIGSVPQEILDYQNQGITIVPDLDAMPDAWAVLRYGQPPAVAPVAVNPEDKNIKLLSEGEVEHFVTGSSNTNLTNVYSQQVNGGAVVTNPVGSQYGAAYFFSAIAYTNIRRARIKLLSLNDNTGSLNISLVEADGSGKPIVGNVIATFPPVDVTTVAMSVDANGTEVDLDSATLFNLDANQNYAFIYHVADVSSPTAAQVIIVGTPDAGTIGGGYINSADPSNIADWVAATSPADAEDLALTLFEEATTVVASGAELRILDKMYLSVPSLPILSNEIAVGNYPMANDDVAVVRLNRTATAGVVGVTIQPTATALDPDDIVIARMFNDEIYVGFNSDLRLPAGESGKLDQGGASSNLSDGSNLNIDRVLQGSIEGDSGTTSSSGVPIKNFENVISKGDTTLFSPLNSSTGLFTVLKAGIFTASGSLNSTVSTTGAMILINGVAVSTENGSNNTFDSAASWSGYLNVGDTVGFATQGTGSNGYRFSLAASVVEKQLLNELLSVETVNTVINNNYTGTTVDVNDKVGVIHEVFAAGQSYDTNSPAGSLVKRLLSTVHRATSWMSLDIVNNRVLLQPGVYRTDISSPALYAGGHRIYLMEYNNGVLSKVLKSDNAYSRVTTAATSDQTNCRINDILTVTTPTYFEVHHYNSAVYLGSTGDHGVAVNEGGESEIYTTVMFDKLGEITNNVTINTTVNGTVDPADAVFSVQHREAYNINGGTKPAGDFVRPFNHVKTTATWGSLTVNDSVVIEAGHYFITGFAETFFTNRCFLSLLDNTNNTETPLVSGFANSVTPTTSINMNFSHKVTLTTQTVFQLNHFSASTRATNGLGVTHANAANSTVENVYAELNFMKLGDI